MKNNTKQIEALKAIYDQSNRCQYVFDMFEQNPELESPWLTEEHICDGMRKMYQVVFGERAPLTRTELIERITVLA